MNQRSDENEQRKYVSFEVLDELMRVTDTKGWLGLISIIFLLAFCVLWLFVGKVPSKVSGSGMLINISGIETVSSNTSGRIERFDVRVGDVIKKGQPVAYISQIVMENDLLNAKQKTTEQKFTNQEKEEIRSRLEKQYNNELKVLNQKLESLSKLLKTGIVLEKEALETKFSITEVKKKLEEFNIERINDKNILSSLERDLKTLEEKYLNESTILSPYDGRVIELEEDLGNIVKPGSTLFTLESDIKKNKPTRGNCFCFCP